MVAYLENKNQEPKNKIELSASTSNFRQIEHEGMTSGKIPPKDTPTLEDLWNTAVDPLEKLVNYFNEQDPLFAPGDMDRLEKIFDKAQEFSSQTLESIQKRRKK